MLPPADGSPITSRLDVVISLPKAEQMQDATLYKAVVSQRHRGGIPVRNQMLVA
jgi:hypothetical protein